MPPLPVGWWLPAKDYFSLHQSLGELRQNPRERTDQRKEWFPPPGFSFLNTTSLVHSDLLVAHVRAPSPDLHILAYQPLRIKLTR